MVVVFEPVMDGLGPRETLAALEQSVVQQVRAECAQIELAEHWAVQHPGETVRPGVVPGLERRVRLGGEGTPEVAEFAAVELAGVLGLADWQARSLIADSLDLRFRLPRLWELVLAGRVHGWRARRIAARTRALSLDAARRVDAEVWECVESMPWQRFSDFLESKILLADPGRAMRLAEQARRDRHVYVSRRPRHGTKTVRMRLDAADANLLEDAISRTAGILQGAAAAGEQLPGVADRRCESEQEFRAQSAGLLAQPLLAAQLMARAQSDLFDGAPPEAGDGRIETDAETLRPVITPGTDGQLSGPVSAWLLRADLSKLVPRAVLHVHISDAALRSGTGIARVEDVGPMIMEQVRAWLGSGVQLRLQPVIDANDMTPSDAYEVPDRMRGAVSARSPASCFPWSTTVSRRMDLDHTIPYQQGRPGQTWVGNLGPLTRSEHRVKTHGGWRVCQPVPGTWMWRSPYGFVYVVNHTGTHALGRDGFAQLVWSAAAPAPPKPVAGPIEKRFREFIRDLDIRVEIDARRWRHSRHPRR